MRIAIVHENWGAGAARCARDLESALGRDHEILYFPRSAHENRETVLRGLMDFAPEVVNCHSFYGGLPYGLLAEISRHFPVCFTVHDPRPIGMMETACWTCDHSSWCIRCPLVAGNLNPVVRSRYFRQRLRKRLCHFRCRGDMRVVAPSEWMANRLRSHELRRFRISHIPNGIDLQKFHPSPAERLRFGLPDHAPVLLHVAWHSKPWSINHRKGLHHLSAAFIEGVVPRFPSAVLAVAGESLVPNHPNVRPVGAITQEELPALLRCADVFVSPTLADNFPYTILEAMACGRAVVASRVGGVAEQVEDGVTGLLVSAGNEAQLAQALIELLSCPDKTKDFERAGRARAEQYFGMDRFVRTYEATFEELAGLSL